MNVLQLRAGNRKLHRIGARREKKPVEWSNAAVVEPDVPPGNIDLRYRHPSNEIDGMLGVKLSGTERNPFFRCVACEVILGKIRPIVRY